MKMKKRVFLCVFLAVAMLFVGCFAQAAGVARQLVDAGVSLLFSVDNVTLNGHADFYLNGERFKTANVVYKQAGTDSYWDLDLLTPRVFRKDQETGYIIIANGEKLFVMERFYPGTYNDGSDWPCETLVRRSVRSDTLVSMARVLADQLEILLPQGAFTVTDTAGGGQEISVKLDRPSVPDIVNPFLNLGVDFALKRFMGIDFDRQSSGLFEDYETVTQGILFTTTSFELGEASFTAELDEQGRLRHTAGTVTALLSSAETAETPLKIDFELDVTDYGSTFVRLFDPAEYDVVPAGTGYAREPVVDPILADLLTARARAALVAAGNKLEEFSSEPEIMSAIGLYFVTFPGYGDFDVVTVRLNDEGSVLSIADGREEWYMADAHELSSPELTDEEVSLLRAFLQEGFPYLAEQCATFIPRLEYDWEGAVYIYITARDASGADLPYSFQLRTTAPLRIVDYNCLPD